MGVFFGLGVALFLETISIYYSGPIFWIFFSLVSLHFLKMQISAIFIRFRYILLLLLLCQSMPTILALSNMTTKSWLLSPKSLPEKSNTYSSKKLEFQDKHHTRYKSNNIKNFCFSCKSELFRLNPDWFVCWLLPLSTWFFAFTLVSKELQGHPTTSLPFSSWTWACMGHTTVPWNWSMEKRYTLCLAFMLFLDWFAFCLLYTSSHRYTIFHDTYPFYF